jgi:hypothetical protein
VLRVPQLVFRDHESCSWWVGGDLISYGCLVAFGMLTSV